MYPRDNALLILVAAFTAFRQPRRIYADSNEQTTTYPSPKCHFYGCPLLPVDVYYNEQARNALNTLKENAGTEIEQEEARKILKSSGRNDIATLTLIGYKGGQLSSQINQDRAFVVAPFYTNKGDENIQEEETDSMKYSQVNKLLGVFDGHAKRGEIVSEYTVTELPRMVSSKLNSTLGSECKATGETSDDGEKEKVTSILVETFLELNKKVPADPTGGCTASVILQLGPSMYFANAGDSRSFLASYINGKARILYITREDKPSLPEEKARVEAMGGEVYIPDPARGGTSRVVYKDKYGSMNGLAMSRSIGDWDAQARGVTSKPLVEVISLPDILADQAIGSCMNIGAMGEMYVDAACIPVDPEEIQFFAVSGSDGLFDFVEPAEVAEAVGDGLFKEGRHPLSACQELIMDAASRWYKAKKGSYRDDIAISVSKITIPKAQQIVDNYSIDV